ncbi:putative transcription factor interactor and regulator CCHC(Zn) family [Helianthus annuus]|uniref:Transcription factor interactor and regulator CCHC(Zn) family n=1 Tax=Helianthus annuus TaxID=4232 RepID=A0A9K3IJS7_HELAN|nr:putative transcription factor interactor and regulator CCHC(Zn) family [Helianthus annuus]KAJ0549850.1 putative transcription factor interactor and regulator CCHC(Zn) family [Helianthus annuus]KAJ0556380.1 putative transcription factor interactor and regulator CCHC(Zn) family [Helianthus annuus]KAJ0562808.1 putative transcription factor interactor and regulator CCHC(Zn) family [Helianthus annuus]KAJ0904341.1 putative transcription factor interactor and regulator CCHC(Zn) family [Helianthus a
MDIKWCLASAFRRAEKFQQITGRDEFRGMDTSPLGFDKSKVTCFRCKRKGHFKRECTNKEATGNQEKNDYYQKSIFHQITQQKEPQTAHARGIDDGKRKMIEDANKKAYFGIIDQDDEKMAAGFSWDKYVQENPHLSSAFVARILEETSVKSEPKRIPIFPELGVEADTDDEEEYVEKARRGLDTDSFILFFAEKIEMLKEIRAARLKREWEETEARKAAEEKGKVEAEKAEVEESSTKKAKEQKAEIEFEEPVVEKIIEKVVEVEKPCLKCLESCKACEEKDKKIAELEKTKEDLLSDVKYVKESYDVLNITVDSLKRTNSEIENAMTKMNSTLMMKQKVINEYIEDCAKLKQDLELEKIESERIKRFLLSYTTCDYLIDRVYPTVAGLEAF